MSHEEMCKQYAQEKLEQAKRLSELAKKQRELRELQDKQQTILKNGKDN